MDQQHLSRAAPRTAGCCTAVYGGPGDPRVLDDDDGARATGPSPSCGPMGLRGEPAPVQVFATGGPSPSTSPATCSPAPDHP
ncbi:MAG: hypothetical protein IPM94_13995 [bacterium]|nr:hypothetical protein [bacterium]